MVDRQRYVAENDDAFYWERVKRNLGWLGNTEEEQRERQLKLKNAVIGVAGAAASAARPPIASCGWASKT